MAEKPRVLSVKIRDDSDGSLKEQAAPPHGPQWVPVEKPAEAKQTTFEEKLVVQPQVPEPAPQVQQPLPPAPQEEVLPVRFAEEKRPIVKEVREEEDFSRILSKPQSDVIKEYREAASKDILPPKPPTAVPLTIDEIQRKAEADKQNRTLFGRIKGLLRMD